MKQVVATYEAPKHTGEQIAARFAAENFNPPRKVGEWNNDRTMFQLADGIAWYELKITGTGWQVIKNL